MTPRREAQGLPLKQLIEADATELKLPTGKRCFRRTATNATCEQQTPIA